MRRYRTAYRCPECYGHGGDHHPSCPNAPEADEAPLGLDPEEAFAQEADAREDDYDPYAPFGEDDIAWMKEQERWS